ncbi:dihydropyrimidinase [Leucobacter chinensis]|uniref:dihydropyrimidinase n=1 Tax=Leucobacter chinensis TaxID=2851010 RepID=UPI001C229F5A|nr:dihydropyrimidinase [Leucobacter chinensis]
MTYTLLHGGTVVDVSGQTLTDILIKDGEITAVGNFSHLSEGDIQRIDCTGMLLLPGGVDVHTHLDSPLMGTTTADDFESGTIAAAMGGTTTIVDFAMQTPGSTLLDSLQVHREKAKHKAAIDYGMHMCITDLYDGAIDELPVLRQEGVSSLKIFMAYRGTLMLNDGQMYDVLKGASKAGSQVCVHAENGDVIDRIAEELVAQGKTGPGYHELARPPKTEIEAVERAIRIADMAEAPLYFVHLTTEGSVEAVARARSVGMPVSAETCTHYLTLDRAIYDEPGFEPAKAVLTPPLRTFEHREALWRGLNSGALSVVSSDHCPFCFEDKQRLVGADFRSIPNGGPGVEHRMSVVYGKGVAERKITIEKFVEITSTFPAQQFGLYPQKGHLGVGADADVVVLDPQGVTQISAGSQFQNIDYTLYEGWSLPGEIKKVFSRGKLVAADGQFVGQVGNGKYLQRAGY